MKIWHAHAAVTPVAPKKSLSLRLAATLGPAFPLLTFLAGILVANIVVHTMNAVLK